ncbi:MAG: 3-dehydroquinate synthase [Clostridia bacterium]|nr:3-dehydroquinate synthase [Clostridia bacterium]
MIIPVKTSQGNYDIVFGRGSLDNAKKHMNLDRRVLIVTDSGVPKEYSEKIASFCKTPVIHTIPQGEASKTLDTFKELLEVLVKSSFTRSDCVVAVGGGVVGDLSGFVASAFMRGIDFYNIPTTFLSQVDSSVGGKTAIDFMGLKNIVGAFYPPKCVIVDPDTLSTLPDRQISNGIAESIKMAATSDKELFEFLETCDINDPSSTDFIIERSLIIKKNVVEEDEKESGLRRVLNFGHTLAHAIESVSEFSELYHGECVALGMLPMCTSEVRARLINILKKFNLPTSFEANVDSLIKAASHDKKLSGDKITLVYVNSPAEFEFRKIPFSEYEALLREALK